MLRNMLVVCERDKFSVSFQYWISEMAVHIVGRVSLGLGRRWFSCSTASRTSMCRALVYGSFGQPEDVVRLVPEWNYGMGAGPAIFGGVVFT